MPTSFNMFNFDFASLKNLFSKSSPETKYRVVVPPGAALYESILGPQFSREAKNSTYDVAWSIDQIKAVKGRETYRFVITEDHELLFAPCSCYHIELARGKKVYAAGDCIIENGQLLSIDNRSGTYRPPEETGRLAESALASVGFEAVGKFTKYVEDPAMFNEDDLRQIKADLPEMMREAKERYQKYHKPSAPSSPHAAAPPTPSPVSDEILYRGLMMNQLQKEAMRGMERDAKAVSIQKEYQTQCEAKGIIPGSNESILLMGHYLKQLDARREELKVKQDGFRLRKNMADFAIFCGEMSAGRGAIRFGIGLESFNQALTGINAITNELELMDLKGISAEGIGNVGLGIFCILKVIFSLVDKEEPESEGLAEALSAIYSAILGMWKEMRQSFQHTWNMLEKMEENNVKRYIETIKKIDETISHITKLTHDQAMSFERVHAEISHMYGHIASALDDLLDAGCKTALAKAKKCRKEEELDTHLIDILSNIVVWLNETAGSKAKNGFKDLRLEGSADKMLVALRPELHPANQLGLLAALANDYVPAYIAHPERLVADPSWEVVCDAYNQLQRFRYRRGIAEADREHVLSEIAQVHTKAETVTQFIAGLIQPDKGKLLFDAIIARYARKLAEVKTYVESKLEEQRRKLNHDHGVAEDEVLLKLDETAGDACTRLNGSWKGRRWLKDTDFDWENWPFELASEAEMKEAATAWKLNYIEENRFGSYPTRLSRHPDQSEHPESVVLGSDRVVTLRDFEKWPHWTNKLHASVNADELRSTNELFNIAKTQPIIALGIKYGVVIPKGKFIYSIVGTCSVHQGIAAYFIFQMEIDNKTYPFFAAQFLPDGRLREGLDMYIKPFYGYEGRFARMIPYASKYFITMPFVTALNTLQIESCKIVAENLDKDIHFTQLLNELEVIRLTLISFFDLLHLPTTNLKMISPEQIKLQLADIQGKPDVNKVKALLTSLDMAAIEKTLGKTLAAQVWEQVPSVLNVPYHASLQRAMQCLMDLEVFVRTAPVLAPHASPAPTTDAVLREEVRELREQVTGLNHKVEGLEQKVDGLEKINLELLARVDLLLARIPAPVPPTAPASASGATGRFDFGAFGRR